MKKSITALSVLFLGFSFAAPAFAISACPTGSFSSLCLDANSVGPVIGSFITLLFVLAGVIALAYLVWGGLKWILSQGDKNELEGARNHIVAALIGLIVIFLSYLLINILLGFFVPGLSLSHFTLPTLQH
ncbi:MAG: hypothetical protein ACREGI_01120 [Candidatus Levyibacteriota bacterium]